MKLDSQRRLHLLVILSLLFFVSRLNKTPGNNYGSSFSRAIRIDSSDHHWMSVSGTASILPSGETTHIGDLKNQILHSFDVVSKIIEQEGFMWEDVTRATAYVKDKENLSILKDVLNTDLPYRVPLIVTQNTICRDDLLFEIEADLYS